MAYFLMINDHTYFCDLKLHVPLRQKILEYAYFCKNGANILTIIVISRPSFHGELTIKFPFKRKACQVYRVQYGRGWIW